MKFKKLIFFLLVIFLVGLLSNTDSWAITAYMKVEGEQGEIPGGTTIEGYENWITVASFGHSINIPTDPQSGQPIGTREHGSLRIAKPLDKASPLLYKALVRGERLPVVEIRFLRLSPEGQMEHFYTIKLEDAIIISASPSLIPSDQDNLMMEIISFNYRRITWTYVPEGIEEQDDWRAVPQ